MKRTLIRLKAELSRRTAELNAANRRLQSGIGRRKDVELALKKSGAHHARLLKESLQLQDGLRQLAHRVLAGQEKQRHKMSCKLQNDIAQTLVGINVRLLTLRHETCLNGREFKREIASAQRLVVRSAQAVRRTARGFHHS